MGHLAHVSINNGAAALPGGKEMQRMLKGSIITEEE
jgi:hypothetical protein